MCLDVTRLIDLRLYGYAPGGYLHPCRACNRPPHERETGDKRAWRCFPCAAKLALTNPRTQGELLQ